MSWPTVPLSELCRMDCRGVRPDDPDMSLLLFIGVENIEPDSGNINFSNGTRIGNQKSTNFRFDERHILYGKLRPYLNKVAIPAFTGKCSTELIPLLPQVGVNREFLGYLLRQKKTVEYVMSSVTGTQMPRTDMKALMSLPVPLPPLEEQRRIVSILNRAAKIEQLRKQAQERLREFIPALFIRMFGDPVENPMGWDMAELSALGNLDRGRSRHRPRNAHELYGGPYPFIQTGDVANSNGLIQSVSQTYSEIGLRQSKLWPAGTLCITIAANIGKTGVLAFDACFPDSIVGFTPQKSIIVEYVQSALNLMQKRIEETAPMAAQRNINLKSLRELRIPIPSLIHQQRFAKIIKSMFSMSTHAMSIQYNVDKLTESLNSQLLKSDVEFGDKNVCYREIEDTTVSGLRVATSNNSP